MSEPQASASKWDFLAATVLFGLRPETNELLLGSEPTGPVWVCWTDQALAEHQLPAGYALRQGRVSAMLPLLPADASVRLDPGRPWGQHFDAAYRAELAALCAPFPAGVHVLPLSDLPAEVASWVRQARPVAER